MDKTSIKVKQMDKDKRRAFYQSKYEYYKGFNRGILIISCITYSVYKSLLFIGEWCAKAIYRV